MSESDQQQSGARKSGTAPLKRRTDLLGGYSSALLLLVVFCIATGVGVVVIRDLRTTNAEVQRMYAGSVVGLRRIGELQYQAQETRRTTLYALTTSDSNLQVQYADESRQADSRVSEGIKEHLGQARAQREIDAGRRLERDWSAYLEVRDEVLASILEGSVKEAVDLDLTQGVPAFDRVRQELEEIKARYHAQASEQLAQIQASSRRSVFKLIAILCLTLLFASVSVWTIQRSKMLGALQQSEASLRHSNERIQLLLDSTAEAIYGIDLQGNCTFSNAVCARLLGFSNPSDLLGKNLHDLMHHTRADGTAVRREDCGLCRALLQAQPAHAQQEVFWRLDGTSFAVEYWSYPMRQGEELLGAVVTFLDISERTQLEDQLRQAQKMEAVGRLAGGIAHDFNNLLMVIRGYSELLVEGMGSAETVRSNADAIKNAAERATSLTQQLLAFSRMQMLQPKVLDLNVVVADMAKMLRHLIPANIEICMLPSGSVQGVKADRGQIEQVLLNLAVNARDAMPNGGKLTIETATVAVDTSHPIARRHPKFIPGNYVLLSLRDTGVGMDARTKAHIFEPFFTTKEMGKGTGLGLATVYGVVKQSGGWIWVESELGKGAVFQIYLPRVGELIRAPEARAPAPATSGGVETILLVEDQDAVRDVARKFLQASGYRVLEAKDGGQALGLAQQYEGPIHLLLTDMMMPGMAGPELAKRLAALRPATKVIFMSGYTEFSANPQESDEKTVFLMKPFERNELLSVVRSSLDQSEEIDIQAPQINADKQR